MEQFIVLNKLLEHLRTLVDKDSDVEEIQRVLEKVHFELLRRDLLNKNIKETNFEDNINIISKIGFYLMNKLTNYEGDNHAIKNRGLSIAAFCFENLSKIKMLTELERIENYYFAAICYSLCENQASGIVLAKKGLDELYKYEIDDKILKIFLLLLGREFKKIIKIPLESERLDLNLEILHATKEFSKSMLYNETREKEIKILSDLETKLLKDRSEYYYSFRLLVLVVKKMDSCSIRKLNVMYPNLREYIDVLTQIDSKNVYELWDSQSFLFNEEFRNYHIDNNKIFLLSMPTSAGKTLIAELLVYNALSSKQGIAIYVVPTIALSNEVEDSFIKRYKKVKIDVKKEIEYLDGDNELIDTEPVVLILTPEKLDLLIRKNPEIMIDIKIVIFDEFHKVSDGGRGWLQETLIAWFIYNKDKYSYKLILMSAIINDIDESITNLGLFDIHISDWMPTKKIYGVFYIPQNEKKLYGDKLVGNTLIAPKSVINEPYYLQVKYGRELYSIERNVFSRVTYGKVRTIGRDPNKSDTKFDICWKTISSLNTEPIMVYFYRKKDIMSFVNKAEKYLPKENNVNLEMLRINISKQLGINHPLCISLQYGVAYHNGDLPEDVRLVIESAYKKKLIKILVCTTTLADGVNMPVSTLVIGNFFNHDASFCLNKSDYKNMVGRIGRALVDTEGKIFLIKYPEYFKTILGKFVEYYFAEQIKNPLKSAVEQINYMHQEIDELEDLEDNYLLVQQENAKSILDRIQIFVFSLYEMDSDKSFDDFYNIYNKSFFIKVNDIVITKVKENIHNSYDLARSIEFSFLQKCNKTGVSYSTNKSLQEISNIIEDTDKFDEVLTEQIYLRLLECNEFKPKISNVNHYSILMLWLKESSYYDIRNSEFGGSENSNIGLATEKCTTYIRDMFQYKVPWVFSALLVFLQENINASKVIQNVLQCIKYGTLNNNVVRLCTTGIRSRELAIELEKAYSLNNTEDEIVEWVVKANEMTLKQHLSHKFDRYTLEQVSKYRAIRREKTNYFSKSGRVRCDIAGITFHDYKIAYNNSYITQDSNLVLVQDSDNQYDVYAVKVFLDTPEYLLGYIPISFSEEVFDLLESGKLIQCTVKEFTHNKLQMLMILT